MGIYVLTYKNLKALELADLIVDAVMSYIELLKLIVSNYKPIFISLF